MRFLTKRELAELLRVSERTVNTWIRERKLECVKPAGKVLFAEDEVQRFIDAGRKPGRFE